MANILKFFEKIAKNHEKWAKLTVLQAKMGKISQKKKLKGKIIRDNKCLYDCLFYRLKHL